MDFDTRECFNRIEKQLERLTIEVCQNSKDIAELKATANMGKGALRVILFFGSLVAIVLSVIKVGENI
tara:strand:- start:3134 stop:3337 length:204 start_codon:yes stop_codon:yes gene_type:complete